MTCMFQFHVICLDVVLICHFVPAAASSGVYQLMKAFFANDPSRAVQELSDLSEIDADKSGHIDERELKALQGAKIKVSGADRFMELLSTHPNMAKRIQALAKMEN